MIEVELHSEAINASAAVNLLLTVDYALTNRSPFQIRGTT